MGSKQLSVAAGQVNTGRMLNLEIFLLMSTALRLFEKTLSTFLPQDLSQSLAPRLVVCNVFVILTSHSPRPSHIRPGKCHEFVDISRT